MVYNEKVETVINYLVDSLFDNKETIASFEKKIWKYAGGKNFNDARLYNLVQFTMESRAFSKYNPELFNSVIRKLEKEMTLNYKLRMEVLKGNHNLGNQGR